MTRLHWNIGVVLALACTVDSRELAILDAVGGSSGNMGEGVGGASPSGSGGEAGSLSGSGGGAGLASGGSGGSGVGGTASLSNAGAAGDGAVTPDAGDEFEPPEAICTGCVELTVPFAPLASGLQQQAIFQLNYTPALDFSNAVVTWRVQVLEGLNRSDLNLYLVTQNGEAQLFNGVFGTPRAFTAQNGFVAGNWTDVGLDVSASPVPAAGDTTSFDKRVVQSVAIIIAAAGNLAGPITARVLVDSVTIAGVPASGGATFTLSSEGLILNQYEVPPGTGQPIHHP